MGRSRERKKKSSMDRFFQVFFSSTFEDLKDECSQVSNAIAKAGYVAAGMELFPASDQQQLEYIKRIIDRSDYYVVIVGGRYGSEADNGLSYTENEFDYARSEKLPVLAFLPADPAAIASGKSESDAAKREKLERFKSKLKNWSDRRALEGYKRSLSEGCDGRRARHQSQSAPRMDSR